MEKEPFMKCVRVVAATQEEDPKTFPGISGQFNPDRVQNRSSSASEREPCHMSSGYIASDFL